MESHSPAIDYAERVGIYPSWVPPDHAKDAREALAGLVAERDHLRSVLFDIASFETRSPDMLTVRAMARKAVES